ncbi:MAG: protein kinase [Thermoguttaceae bacterium]|jgi:serine/threonine protein kinase
MPTTICPSHDELLAYAAGCLSEEVSEAVAEHLDSCPQCQTGLVTLDDADDTFVAQLRRPADSDPILDESQCRVAVTRARAVLDGSYSPQGRSSQSVIGKVFGEYQLLEELGCGGMGTVYKALHTKLDRVVALKVLTLGRANDHRAIARFEREMKAVGCLDNPHIVRAHDAREIEGMPMLVMEYIDGLDLAEIVRRTGPMSAADACESARQAALGLQYVHKHGLVHRDIKPSNLMLTPQGEIKILDLGLARFHLDQPLDEETTGTVHAAAGEMTGTDQAMGTADYMAPEQISNSRNVDIRADIYSLGCTLYKLLSGRAPFSGPEFKGPVEKMAAHAGQSAPPIRRFNPQVPAELAAVLDRMMAKEPADRFASPAEAAAALAGFTGSADLPALLARATSQNPAPGESSYNSALHRKSSYPAPTVVATASGRGRRIIWTALIGLLFLGGMGWALGILLRVERDGKTTEINIPDGSNVTISENGQVDVKLAENVSSSRSHPDK